MKIRTLKVELADQVANGLNYIATWNAAMLLSTDLDESLAAVREKRAPKFRD